MVLPSVFISYSSKDVEIVEVIEHHLVKNGFDGNVWRDKRKIETDWSREIANALSKSDIVLLIWSENSSKSEWVKNEWLTARALGKPIQLVIISALDKLPKPLSNLDAIVFENNENDDNIDYNSRQKIIDKLKEAAESNLHQEYNYNILPHKRNIPYDPNPNFTGRDIELVDLYLEIIGDLSKLNYNKVGITGIGGVGKTQLAVEFFYRYAFAFEDGIFWIDGYDSARWLEQIVSIARDYLKLEIPKEEGIITEPEKNKRYFIEFQKYCSENGSKMLLLVDNVIDPLDLNMDNILFPVDPTSKFTLLTISCNLLFTTRRDFQDKLSTNVIEHKLAMLIPDSAYELLTKYRKPDSSEIEYANKICNSVGYLPLAIVLVGAYLRKYSDITVEEYYEEHIKDKLSSIDLDQISGNELATKHAAAVRSTFEPEWKILEKDYSEGSLQQQQLHLQKPQETQNNQNSKKLVSILSLLPESAIIPKNRIIIYSGIEKFGKTKLIRPAQYAINFLDEMNLIDILENGKSVRIHPLLREFVYEKIQKNQNIENLMLESINNLKKKYYDDFSYLVDEYSGERDADIDSISNDFKTVLEWSETKRLKKSKDDPIINYLYSLYKILEQESHNLRLKERNSFISTSSDKIDKQLVFAQQIHIRATELGQNKIIQGSLEYLQANKISYFNVLWAIAKDKNALKIILDSHTSSVETVAITLDSTKIVSGSTDKTIKVWDLASGNLLNTLDGHTSSVETVAITPDSTKIVSGSRDKTIKVWDLASGNLLNTLKDHTSSVETVAITLDSTKIVSGSTDKTIKVWDLASGNLLNTLKGHTSSVETVAITPDSTKIVSGSGDYTINVWDLASGNLLNTLDGHIFWVNSVAITPDSTKIVSGSTDKTIKVWDLASGNLLNTLDGHTSSVETVAITPDSTKIVSGSRDKTIKVWDLASGNLLNTLEGYTVRSVSSLAITPDSTKIVCTGSYDNTIEVWDLASDSLINTFEGHTESVSSVAITPDSTKIVSGSRDNTVKVWDLASGRLLNTLKGYNGSFTSLALIPDSTKIVSGTRDNTIEVWDLASDNLINTFEGHTGGSVSSLAITPDSTKIVSAGSYDNTIEVWDLASGRLLNTLKGHRDYVSSLAITPDSTKIVSGSRDNTVKVWDLASGRLLNTLKGHTESVSSLAITPDSTKIVSGSWDNTIKVWDLASGRLLNTLKGHTESVSSLAITPDSTKIVSGSWDNTIKVWDLNKGSITSDCKFDSPIYSIAISNNQNILAFGNSNGEIYAIEMV